MSPPPTMPSLIRSAASRFFPKALEGVFSREANAGHKGVLLEFPGPDEGGWERWLFQNRDPKQTSGEGPRRLAGQDAPPSQCTRIVSLPSARMFSWPLWITSEGDASELARLQLSGSHLLRREMSPSLRTLPLLSNHSRSLVLAVSPEEPFSETGMPDDWKGADRFDIPARMLPEAGDCDLVLWREWGTLQACFFRNRKPVWFCGISPEHLSGMLKRSALRLIGEGVLERAPETIALRNLFGSLSSRVTEGLKAAFPDARVLPSPSEPPPPVPPTDGFQIPPSEAREEKAVRERRSRILFFWACAALVYLLLLLWGGGSLLLERIQLGKIRKQIALLEAPANLAKGDSDKWHALRQAVDPGAYALNLLAAVASPTEGGRVRLTRFALEHGRLQISGEATDVTQAYSFIEQLKKNPLLQEYDWSAGQPQLAGKNSVRFDMEGTRPDATTGAK